MKLHKNNGSREAWELRDESILRVFRSSNEWGEHLAGLQLEVALRKFIASPKGLASSFDEGGFKALMRTARGGKDFETTDLHRFERGKER